MGKFSVELQCTTDPDWVETILERFDEFLPDHANCERKASALALSMIVKQPDRVRIIPTLIAIAREELEHFERVYALMGERGLTLAKDEPDPYVNRLLGCMRHGRQERFLDRLLVFALVEARGAERLARTLADPELARFYRRLRGAEAKHGHQFAQMALEYFDESTVAARARELAAREAEIATTLPWRASLH
jgi:tRNA-(ms[2]io[6]A)-hydroxylase